ncbi:MAG: PASTA domain-containing protein [Bacteroidetes bacterium]|jgi:cell division protein FtsI (penicillin-binding protein 3)|nr:PASTA domain-containing protein [Bacteroidota bacterium]
MSIGYEVQVTPMQLIQAYSALANGGILMKPYVVRSVQDEYGNIIEEQEPMAIRRVAKKETIQKIIPILEQVVTEDGTAGWADVEGLRIAGKTGTAQKYEDGRYRTRYRASFVGFFPVEDPKYTVLVLLDEPKTSIYGGFTAGSIFKEIAIRLSGMDHSIRKSFEEPVTSNRDSLSIPKLTGLSKQQGEYLSDDLNLTLDFRGEGGVIVSQQPDPGTRVAAGSKITLELSPLMAEETDDEYLTIPDLSGMDMRRATNSLLSLGLTVNSIGSGSVRTQFPKPGEWMKPGRTVTIRGSERSKTIVSN